MEWWRDDYFARFEEQRAEVLELIYLCAIPTSDGCLRWPGMLNRTGYAVYKSKPVYHRLLWAPDGMIRGHICHDRAVIAGTCVDGLACPHKLCVNIEHLQLQTPRENWLATSTYRNLRK
jgi:hypothetical protein